MPEGGTVFLDEVAELPPTAPGQTPARTSGREFVRLGGTSSIKLNVRFIAATTRTSRKRHRRKIPPSTSSIALTSFPSPCRPFASHPEDILCLTDHFVSRYSRASNRKVRDFSTAARACLANTIWPGQHPRTGERHRSAPSSSAPPT